MSKLDKTSKLDSLKKELKALRIYLLYSLLSLFIVIFAIINFREILSDLELIIICAIALIVNGVGDTLMIRKMCKVKKEIKQIEENSN